MKNFKSKIRIFAVIAITAIITSFTTLNNQDASIIGSWISEEDNNYVMVFNENNCTWLYSGQSTASFTFTLANTSPQCGEIVPVSNELNYLKLINTYNSQDQYCYEIYGLTETKLTLRPLDKSGFLVFNRQP